MWDCDECGEENFERGFIPEGDAQALEEVKRESGLEQETMLCAVPV
jgi:hypothetical protein